MNINDFNSSTLLLSSCHVYGKSSGSLLPSQVHLILMREERKRKALEKHFLDSLCADYLVKLVQHARRRRKSMKTYTKAVLFWLQKCFKRFREGVSLIASNNRALQSGSDYYRSEWLNYVVSYFIRQFQYAIRRRRNFIVRSGVLCARLQFPPLKLTKHCPADDAIQQTCMRFRNRKSCKITLVRLRNNARFGSGLLENVEVVRRYKSTRDAFSLLLRRIIEKLSVRSWTVSVLFHSVVANYRDTIRGIRRKFRDKEYSNCRSYDAASCEDVEYNNRFSEQWSSPKCRKHRSNGSLCDETCRGDHDIAFTEIFALSRAIKRWFAYRCDRIVEREAHTFCCEGAKVKSARIRKKSVFVHLIRYIQFKRVDDVDCNARNFAADTHYSKRVRSHALMFWNDYTRYVRAQEMEKRAKYLATCKRRYSTHSKVTIDAIEIKSLSVRKSIVVHISKKALSNWKTRMLHDSIVNWKRNVTLSISEYKQYSRGKFFFRNKSLACLFHRWVTRQRTLLLWIRRPDVVPLALAMMKGYFRYWWSTRHSVLVKMRQSFNISKKMCKLVYWNRFQRKLISYSRRLDGYKSMLIKGKERNDRIIKLRWFVRWRAFQLKKAEAVVHEDNLNYTIITPHRKSFWIRSLLRQCRKRNYWNLLQYQLHKYAVTFFKVRKLLLWKRVYNSHIRQKNQLIAAVHARCKKYFKRWYTIARNRVYRKNNHRKSSLHCMTLAYLLTFAKWKSRIGSTKTQNSDYLVPNVAARKSRNNFSIFWVDVKLQSLFQDWVTNIRGRLLRKYHCRYALQYYINKLLGHMRARLSETSHQWAQYQVARKTWKKKRGKSTLHRFLLFSYAKKKAFDRYQRAVRLRNKNLMILWLKMLKDHCVQSRRAEKRAVKFEDIYVKHKSIITIVANVLKFRRQLHLAEYANICHFRHVASRFLGVLRYLGHNHSVLDYEKHQADAQYLYYRKNLVISKLFAFSVFKQAQVKGTLMHHIWRGKRVLRRLRTLVANFHEKFYQFQHVDRWAIRRKCAQFFFNLKLKKRRRVVTYGVYDKAWSMFAHKACLRCMREFVRLTFVSVATKLRQKHRILTNKVDHVIAVWKKRIYDWFLRNLKVNRTSRMYIRHCIVHFYQARELYLTRKFYSNVARMCLRTQRVNRLKYKWLRHIAAKALIKWRDRVDLKIVRREERRYRVQFMRFYYIQRTLRVLNRLRHFHFDVDRIAEEGRCRIITTRCLRTFQQLVKYNKMLKQTVVHGCTMRRFFKNAKKYASFRRVTAYIRMKILKRYVKLWHFRFVLMHSSAVLKVPLRKNVLRNALQMWYEDSLIVRKASEFYFTANFSYARRLLYRWRAFRYDEGHSLSDEVHMNQYLLSRLWVTMKKRLRLWRRSRDRIHHFLLRRGLLRWMKFWRNARVFASQSARSDDYYVFSEKMHTILKLRANKNDSKRRKSKVLDWKAGVRKLALYRGLQMLDSYSCMRWSVEEQKKQLKRHAMERMVKITIKRLQATVRYAMEKRAKRQQRELTHQ